MKELNKNASEINKKYARLLLIYPLQLSFLVVLYLALKQYFGYIVLSSLLLGQIFAILSSNLSDGKEHKIYFSLVRFFGGGFYGIAKNFSDLEKKAKISGSRLQICAFLLQCTAVVTLFYVWMANDPFYTVFSLIASLGVSLVFLLSERDIEEKVTVTLLIWMMFGYGYLLFAFAQPRLYFYRYGRRYSSLEGKKKVSRKRRKASSFTEYLSDCGFENFGSADMRYFPSGARFFDDLFERLRGAEKYIYIEFFIFDDGELLSELEGILSERASVGVDVRVICDHYALSESVKQGAIQSMSSAGVRFAMYNRVVPVLNTFTHYRDHRKMVVIDGACAYTGGVNAADEYVNRIRRFGYWKDSGVRLDGDAALAFKSAFCKQWFAISGEKIEFCENASLKDNSKMITVPYFDRVGDKHSYDIYYKLIESAERELVIVLPYFVPGRLMMKLIAERAKSGVDVTVIIPARPDKKYVYSVTKYNACYLAENGVKVFRMRGAFTHSKIVMTENVVSLGTVNFDSFSFAKCAECGVITDNAEVMDDVRGDVCCVLAVSDRLTPEIFRANVVDYIGGFICSLFSILM